jgi:hypothetical protein
MVPLIAALVLSSWLPAAETDEAAIFEAKIRPLLVERCYECHSARKKNTPSLPGADPQSDRFRCGGRESNCSLTKRALPSLSVAALVHQSL